MPATMAVTGRFQPFHCDHLQLLGEALCRAERVIVAITNPDRALRRAHPASAHRHREDANPFSFAERRAMIDAALRAAPEFAGRCTIVPCDLEDPASWPGIFPPGTVQLVRVFGDWEREKLQRFRAAGCAVLELAGDPARRISASDIRAAWRQGASWQHWVPPGTREWLAHRLGIAT